MNQTMTRKQWNRLATEKVSAIVDGDVEVTLMNDEIGIYGENYELCDKAATHFVEAGSNFVRVAHYEAEDDMPEAWTFIVSLPD